MEWKVLKENSKYLISDTGLIKNRTNGFTLKKTMHHTGYPVVTVLIGKSIKQCPIHRLVATAFIPNPNEYNTVNHINGIKQDNRIENLEWCTQEYNEQHAQINGLKFRAIGELNGCSKLRTIDILDIRERVASGTAQSVLANEYSLSRASVCMIVKGKRWKHLL